MAKPIDKTLCRTPNAEGVTSIPTWKFEVLRGAILSVLREGDLAFKDLKEAVRLRVSEGDLGRLGSLGWHVTCVKLELEVRGEIVRLRGVAPQQLSLGEQRDGGTGDMPMV